MFAGVEEARCEALEGLARALMQVAQDSDDLLTRLLACFVQTKIATQRLRFAVGRDEAGTARAVG